LKLIKQKGVNECGVASAAMAGSGTYRRALGLVSGAEREAGLSVSAMLALLEGLSGGAWGARNPRPRKPMATYKRWPEGTCVALVRRKEVARGHYVAISASPDGIVVYDPEHVRPRPLASYPRRHWELIRVFCRAEAPRRPRKAPARPPDAFSAPESSQGGGS